MADIAEVKIRLGDVALKINGYVGALTAAAVLREEATDLLRACTASGNNELVESAHTALNLSEDNSNRAIEAALAGREYAESYSGFV